MVRAERIVQGKMGGLALFDLDHSLGLHAHSQWHIVIKCGGADGAVRVRDRCYPLTEQSAVLVNRWEPHHYAHPSGAPSSLLLALYVEPLWLAERDRGLAGLAQAGAFADPCVQLSPATRRAADTMAKSLGRSETVEQSVLEQLTFDLAVSVLGEAPGRRALAAAPARRPARDFRIRKALRYIDERANEPLDIDALARHAGLSRAHLFALFRKCTNLSPGLYANVLRMNRAVTRLAASSDTMAVIADDLGFSAQSHFTRFFRCQWGVPPSEYRRANRISGAAHG